MEVSEATIHRWVAQEAIDTGARAHRTSAESAELCAARRRIAELEAELEAVKRASQLFAEGRVVRPNELYPIVAELAAEGHSAKAACRILAITPVRFLPVELRPVG